MFCPDNFYEILRCSYSWPRTPNIISSFVPHGVKHLKALAPLTAGEEEKIWHNEFNEGDRAALGKIILHDQEPFSLDITLTYKQSIRTVENHAEFREIADNLNLADLFSCFLKSGLQPILCHSEINSPDIEECKRDCLIIDCYYWYHGMIAREWFRHWQHHPDLTPRDRSDVGHRFMMYARGLDGTRLYRNNFIDQMRPHADQILYDWHKKNMITSDYSAKISVDDANRSSIHIVLETLFDTSKIHLTEKVFKPMVMSQPFFLLSGPGSLGYLRNYGFRTFGEFWDESYDNITDSNDRMHHIKIEIERLMRMRQSEFSVLYKSMLPIIEHNRKHFYSQEFQEYCIQEMRDNFQKALDLQERNRTIYPGGTWAWITSRIIKRGLELPVPWQPMMRQFLKSQHLTVSPESIIGTYPALSRYQD